ncbi:hypothetical protein BH10ACT7_BH10ACT7_20550 [soil metagenome]
MVVAGVTLALGMSLFSGRAWAVLVDVVENGLPGHLSLASDPMVPVEFLDMSPGTLEQWQIAAKLVDPTASLTMQFARDGALVSRPDGLTVQGQLCTLEWDITVEPATCAGTTTNVFGPVAASNTAVFGPLTANGAPLRASAPVYNLGTLTNTANKYLLVSLSIPYTPAAAADDTLMGLEATLGFGFTATDAAAVPPTPASLPNTGADVAALLLVALGGVGLGAVLLSARRARTTSTEGRARS